MQIGRVDQRRCTSGGDVRSGNNQWHMGFTFEYRALGTPRLIDVINHPAQAAIITPRKITIVLSRIFFDMDARD